MAPSLKTTILKNTAWLTASRIINSIIGYILIVAIARNLGDVGLGQYSFIYAFTSLTFIFGDLGLGYLMIKEVSRKESRAQYYFENLLSLKFFLGIISLLITFSVSLFLQKETEVIRALWIVGLIQFFSLFSTLFTFLMNSFNRMDIDAISSMIERFIALVFGLYILYAGKSLLYFVMILLLSNFLRFLYLLLNVKSKVRFNFNFNYKVWIELVIKGFPYFLSGIFIFLYFRIDTIMISLMKGDEVTGWYNAAYKLIDVLTIIPGIVIISILPSMSKLYETDKKLLSSLFLRTLKYLFMLIIPISVGTIILAERIIFFIYGKSFEGGSISLQILILAEIFVFVNYLMGYLLNSIDKQKYFTIITGICALFNILLNLILIPKFSFVGAGIATVLTEALNFLLLKKFVGNFLVKIKFTLPLFKSLLASIVMGGIVYYFRFLAIWYVIPLGAGVYGLILIILGIENEDKSLVFQIYSYLSDKFRFKK